VLGYNAQMAQRKKQITNFFPSHQCTITSNKKSLTFERGNEKLVHNDPMITMQKSQSESAVSLAFAKVE
jgi:hypothetical protein